MVTNNNGFVKIFIKTEDGPTGKNQASPSLIGGSLIYW